MASGPRSALHAALQREPKAQRAAPGHAIHAPSTIHHPSYRAPAAADLPCSAADLCQVAKPHRTASSTPANHHAGYPSAGPATSQISVHGTLPGMQVLIQFSLTRRVQSARSCCGPSSRDDAGRRHAFPQPYSHHTCVGCTGWQAHPVANDGHDGLAKWRCEEGRNLMRSG